MRMSSVSSRELARWCRVAPRQRWRSGRLAARARFASTIVAMMPSLMARAPRFPCRSTGRQAQHALLGGRGTVELADRAAGGMTTMRSASVRTSGRSEDTTRIARPCILQVTEDAINLGAGTDVDAACRLVDNQQVWLRSQPFRQQHLLLIAAGEVAEQIWRADGVAILN